MITEDLGGVLAGIDAAITALAEDGGLVDQLTDLLTEKGTAPEEALITRPTPGSRAPWDARAADAHLTIHAWARDCEAELRTYLLGSYRRRMRGSDGQTKAALRAISTYVHDGRVPELVCRRTARQLGTLLRMAQSLPAIDLAPPPAATLRQRCPYCGDGKLTAAMDGSTEIRCENARCLDPVTGARPVWPKRDWPFLLERLAGEGA